MSPLRTSCPGSTWMARTILVSSGCTTSVPLGAATMPRPVTTLSIGMNASAARLLSISVLITRVVLRASGCIGSVTRARLGPAKSRRAAAPSSG